jgi:phage recombination protein Bet
VKEVTTELAKTSGVGWSKEDIALIREMCAPKATDSEFKLFLYIAGKYSLDPLTKEIYCQKYWNTKKSEYNPATIFVSYMGMLKVAERTGQLDGIEDECFYNDKGELMGARATVWKKGCAHPFVAEVDLDEYAAPDRNPMWKTANTGGKPKTMIKKVAKMHALRLAFGLSELYAEEEFDRPTDLTKTVEVVPEQPKPLPRAAKPAPVDIVTGEVVEEWQPSSVAENLARWYFAATTEEKFTAINEEAKKAGLDKPNRLWLNDQRKLALEAYNAVLRAEQQAS